MRRCLIRGLIQNLFQQASKAVDDFRQEQVENDSDEKLEKSVFRPNTKQGSVFEALLNNPALSAKEKEAERISQEAFVILAAGGETTSRVLTNATYYILADQESLLASLQAELLQVMPQTSDIPSLVELEKLPLLVCSSTVTG